MSDERLRRLERSAVQGDLGVWATLVAMQAQRLPEQHLGTVAGGWAFQLRLRDGSPRLRSAAGPH